MISKHTEVTFIDEASPSLLDVDDWKILTQGGYTACDVKYKKGKVVLQPMSHGFDCTEKARGSAGNGPKAEVLLFQKPSKSKTEGHTVAAKAPNCNVVHWRGRPIDEEESAEDDEVVERNPQDDEGSLPECEKEILRTLEPADFLTNSSEKQHTQNEPARNQDEQDLDDSEDDETIAALKTSLEQTSLGSLRYRHISHILETRLEEKRRLKQQEEMRYERTKQNLLSRGVSKENILLLPRDNNEPLPTPIRNELAAFEQEQLKAELDERKGKAKKVFQSSWLKTTEKKLYECMVAVETSAGPEMKASMMALREILEDKLKNQHKNLGTLGCKEALSEQKRLCIELGLLQNKDQDLVKNLFEALPLPVTPKTVEDDYEVLNYKPKTPTYVPQNDVDQFWPQSPGTVRELSDSSTPSANLDDKALSEELLRHSSTKRQRDPPLSQARVKRQKNTLFKYFSTSQK